jgi:hypothetical protein
MTFGCFNDMGKKTEIIAKSKKCIFMNFYFPLRIKVRKDSSVFPQQTMNIPDKIIRIAVLSVVVIIPALIRTELLIGTTS